MKQVYYSQADIVTNKRGRVSDLGCGYSLLRLKKIRCKKEGSEYIRHGVEQLKTTSLIDMFRYSRDGSLNYGRSFETLKAYDFSEFEKVNEYKPILTCRPRNAH